MTSRSRWQFAGAFVLGYLLLTSAAGIYLAEGVVRPGRTPLTVADRQSAARLAATYGARVEDVKMIAGDGTRLRAWLFTPAAANNGAVIVLHGQGSNRAGMLPYIDLLLSAGLQVLAPDARAQGDSEGNLASYGVVESGDVRAWALLLRGANGGSCVYGFAESMGAGTLLQALDGGRIFCGVTVESPFASFREVAYDRIGSVFHARAWLGRTLLRPVVESGLFYIRARYGLDLDRAAPLEAIRRTTVPILLIHGTADTSIPPRNSRLLAAARATATSLWEVPGAEHCGALGVAPREFAERVLASFGHPPDKSPDHAR